MMICYKTHMGLQTCAVGGVITSQVTKKQQLTYRLNEKKLVDLTTSSNNLLDQTYFRAHCDHFQKENPLSFFSITIEESAEDIRELESFHEENTKNKLHIKLQASGSEKEEGCNRTIGESGKESSFNHISTAAKAETSVASKTPNPTIIRHNNKPIRDRFDNCDLPKKRFCKSSGQENMNEKEKKDFWEEKNDVNNVQSDTGLGAGDEPESAGSSASLHASDNSEEDCYGNPVAHNNTSKLPETTNTNTSAESSTFLFIGPVGKKRKHCREQRHSGDAEEPEVASPMSACVPTPTGHDNSSSDREPPPLIDDINAETSEDSSRSRGSGKNVGNDEVQSATSTPTSVIKSAPRRRGEEQPLNLSLPISESLQSSSQRVSVINLVHRDRNDETSNAESSSSRSPGGYMQQSHSRDATTGGTSQLSSTPSTLDCFPSSSRSALGRNYNSPLTSPRSRAPSTFQGILGPGSVASPHGGQGNSGQRRKLRCGDCGKEFSQLRNYKYHRSRHEGTQQFSCECPICHKVFNDKGYLSSHLKIHKNEKEYRCEYCVKRFNQRVAYNMHVRIHTGHKPHQCQYCEKAFSRKMLLRQHIRTHTGERPYLCGICQKAFADRSNMLLHQRLHSGDRPFKCHICGKSFSKNHHLKTHLNHHAGIKPYQCSKCKACFSQSSNMKTHFKKCMSLPNANATSSTAEDTPSASSQGPSAAATTSSTRNSTLSLQLSSSGRTSTSTLQLPMFSPLSSVMQQPFPITGSVDAQMQEEHHHNQRIRQTQQGQQLLRLSPSQQQQLLNEAAMSLRHRQSTSTITSPLGSPTRSPYSLVNVQSPQSGLSLGLNSMSLVSPPAMGRSRRQSGLSLINPSPTSLAAGHPFIPLTALENVNLNSGAGSTNQSHLSPSSIPSPSGLLLFSPRQHSNNPRELSPSDLSSSQLSSFSQSSSHQRPLSRSRHAQQQYMPHLQDIPAAAGSSESRSYQLGLQQIPISRLSPGRQLSPRQALSQSQLPPEYYDLIVPVLSVSRGVSQISPRSQQQFRPDFHSEQQSFHRAQDLQRVYRVQNTRNDFGTSSVQNTIQQPHQGLLALSGGTLLSPSGPLPNISTLHPQNRQQLESQEHFLRELPLSTEERNRLAAWRQQREETENSESSDNSQMTFKDDPFRR